MRWQFCGLYPLLKARACSDNYAEKNGKPNGADLTPAIRLADFSAYIFAHFMQAVLQATLPRRISC